jgi:hypothetical protein
LSRSPQRRGRRGVGRMRLTPLTRISLARWRRFSLGDSQGEGLWPRAISGGGDRVKPKEWLRLGELGCGAFFNGKVMMAGKSQSNKCRFRSSGNFQVVGEFLPLLAQNFPREKWVRSRGRLFVFVLNFDLIGLSGGLMHSRSDNRGE